jgi:hypothetical protein
MATDIEKLIEEVQSLSPNEQRRLRSTLDQNLATSAPQPPFTEDEFERLLLAQGLLSRIPPPITDFSEYTRRTPVQIRGKPLSETIIEARP